MRWFPKLRTSSCFAPQDMHLQCPLRRSSTKVPIYSMGLDKGTGRWCSGKPPTSNEELAESTDAGHSGADAEAAPASPSLEKGTLLPFYLKGAKTQTAGSSWHLEEFLPERLAPSQKYIGVIVSLIPIFDNRAPFI